MTEKEKACRWEQRRFPFEMAVVDARSTRKEGTSILGIVQFRAALTRSGADLMKQFDWMLQVTR